MQQPTLTFLHGFMGHPEDWDELRLSLQTTATDSAHPPAMSAPEILPSGDWNSGIDLLAQKIPDHSVLVGYSMGARLALALALGFPEKVGGLVFISGNPGIESQQLRRKRLTHDLKLADELESLSTSEERRTFLEQWYDQPVFTSISEQVRRSEIDRKLEKWNQTQWPEIMRTFSVGLQPDYWPLLTSIKVPVRLIAGEKDEKYKEIATRFATSASPVTTNIELVPDCGHIVHREAPEAITGIIRRFLETLTVN